MTRRWMLVLCLMFAQFGLSLAETGMCPAGTYLAEHGTCVKCPEGSYTNHSNQLTACLPCRGCESGLVEVSLCTPTQNTECGCKAGECLTDDSPEHCEPCRSLSKQPNGTGNDWTAVGVGVGVVVCILLAVSALFCKIHCLGKNKSQGFLDFFKNSPCSFWARCKRHPRTASEIGQNDLNDILIVTESYDERQGHDGRLLDTGDSEQELEIQAQAPLPAEKAQALGDPEQVPTGAGQSQERRRRLVPVEGTNGAESFRIFFNEIPNDVSISCWKPLMRRLGLTDNEIYAAERENSTLHEQMYKMLVTWQEKYGTAASVNTLLETLEAQGQRLSMEVIQDKLVKSGKFIYEDDAAGSVVSQEEETLKPAGLPLLP
ncbi:tumor necrosis factor receptor superfamily member 10A-like [Sorex araneus]|uniref:tumor necrosis factor receptor superfamily member 10A-like n=1 Tax=Sorex araneus TaxID=42254 RepID=UPI00243402B7|nr:tumor necrosis factor receptor superfamily member 10A-like [Sorex araneus]